MKWLFRLTIGLAFALPMVLLTFALVQADDPAAPPATDSCSLCHSDFYEAWSAGAHGQATSDEVFTTLWEAQGKPERCLACHTTGYDPSSGKFEAEGVTCTACHGPIPANHPADPMPTDRTANTCGQCHTDTMFEWQVSQHRQQNLTCSNCHDPHKTQLKADTPSDLCGVCHKEQTEKFSHSVHSQNNVNCADCHLAPEASLASEGHAYRNHSFNVELSTCNKCHADRMHEPIAKPMTQPTPTPLDAMASVETMGVSLEPQPVSPVGFALLAGVLGLGAGLVVAPWLERWYRRARDH